MLKAKRFILLLATIAGCLVINPNRAFACSCVPPGSPSEELARSTAVFSGKVIDVVEVPIDSGDFGLFPMFEVTVKVSRVWKGPLRRTLVITTPMSSASCGYHFEEGQEYLIYVDEFEDRLTVFLCSRTQLLSAADEDLSVLGAGKVPNNVFLSLLACC